MTEPAPRIDTQLSAARRFAGKTSWAVTLVAGVVLAGGCGGGPVPSSEGAHGDGVDDLGDPTGDAAAPADDTSDATGEDAAAGHPGTDTLQADDVATAGDSEGPVDATAPPGDAAPDVPSWPPAETGPGLGIDYAANPGATPRFEPGSIEWSSVGWPNDRLVIGDDHPNLLPFPNPGIDLLTEYLTYGTEVLDGWGLNGSVYFQFDATIELASLPRTTDATDPLAVVQLVNVTVGSPRYGQSTPLEFGWHEDGTDLYYLPRTLAMRPVFGMGLAEGETYCAVITRGVRDVDGGYLQTAPEFADELLTDPSLAPLVAWLTDTSPLHQADVAVASCFTTQHASQELRTVADFIASLDAPDVVWVHEPSVYNEFHGVYLAPNFQAGEKPYEADGDLRFDEGVPIVQSEEELRFLLIAPTLEEMPEGGWPVVLYGHGTGGDYESCRGVTEQLVGEGFALLCIDQPLHGTRRPEAGPLNDNELTVFSFNFLNPRAGRMSFRQSAIDTITLSHMVASGRFGLDGDQTVSGTPLALDPERIFFFGHSHGGLSGALVFAVDPRIVGGVISGAGGVIINTILLRKDPLDIKALVQGALAIAPPDLDTFHPMQSLIQMMVDATDPANYSRYWLDPIGDPTAAKHVFVTEGTSDHATPGIATETMTAIGGLPLITPLSNASAPHDLRGIAPVTMPVTNNVETDDGPRTAASRQWRGASHWVAFDSRQAESMWLTFFRTLRDGGPVTIDTGDAVFAQGAAVAAGETCETGGVIDPASLPAILIGNTSTATDDHAVVGCEGGGDAGEGRRDVAYTFTPDVTGTYRFALYWQVPVDDDELPTGPDRLYVVTDCADVAGSCVQQMAGSTLFIDLDAGTTYHAIIDGSSLEAKGPYELELSLNCAVLDCGERECGAHGCEDCGSCGTGEICSDEGQCKPSAGGDLCDDAVAVGGLPFEASGNTLSHGNDYSFGGSDCPGTGTGRGGASPDAVYRWDVVADGSYTIDLGADYDAAVYAVTDCGAIGDTCLGGQRRWQAPEHLVVDVEAGETVFVIVDGAGNNSPSAGAYTLRVGDCVPDCEDRVCGTDGCGGTCGACDSGHVCVEEETCEPTPFICSATAVCEAYLQGDECSDPLVIGELPYSHQATTKDYYNHYSHGGNDCPGDSSSRGGGSADVAYTFTAPGAGIYRFGISASWDSVLYVATDCDAIDDSCLGGDNVKNKGGEELFLTLDQDEAMVVFVDGSANNSNKSGTYTLTVDTCIPDCADRVCGSDGCGGSCGSCTSSESCSGGQCNLKKGHLCDAPVVVNKSNYDHDSNTSNFDAAFSNPCVDVTDDSGADSNDVLYRLTPGSDATYRLELVSSWEGHLYVMTECGGDSAACVGSAPGGTELELELTGGTAYWIVVDGVAGAGGPYTLDVVKVCFPDCEGHSCGGDGCGGSCGACLAPTDLCQDDQTCLAPSDIAGNTCAAPHEVDTGALPFTATGDTSAGALNHYGLGDEDCTGWQGLGQASPDHVWRLTAPTSGEYVVGVRADGFDVILYAVSDCADIPGTCRAASDTRGEESLALQLDASETVFVVVDGAGNSDADAGSYDLTIQLND